ncbi:MAG: MotA/TolQ/ExbB proton channel family protein [Candidatus Fermentibacteraceae bacterium]|nr:MotA/TolQ/ExbB proton channel family protein [Candidatus Fermentibacteraceae bacterium]
MRKYLLLFLVLASIVWAQPEEPGSGDPVDAEQSTEVTEEQTGQAEQTGAEIAGAPQGEEVERAQSASMDLMDLFIAGGAFMWPLLISLLIGLAVTIERFISYKKVKIDVGPFLERMGGFIRKGDVNGAEELCERTRGPVAAIMHAGLLRHDKGLEAVEKAVESAGGIEMAYLEKGIVVLASVSSIAPMLGFLGTVSGMIKAFGEIAAAKNVEASLVAGGIQEALITTATGLTIAIPIQMAHNYFISRIGRFVIDMEEASIFLVDTLAEMEHLKQL